jgi:hypothetical protein
MDQDVTEILKEAIGRLRLSLREVVGKGGEILVNLKKVNIKDVYWPTQLGRIWSKNTSLITGKSLGEDAKQMKVKVTEETVEENCSNVVPLLKFVPGCEVQML